MSLRIGILAFGSGLTYTTFSYLIISAILAAYIKVRFLYGCQQRCRAH